MLYDDQLYMIKVLMLNPFTYKGELRTVPVLATSFPHAIRVSRTVNYWQLACFEDFKKEYSFLMRGAVLKWVEYKVDRGGLLSAWTESLLRNFKTEALDNGEELVLRLLTDTRRIIEYRYKNKNENGG